MPTPVDRALQSRNMFLGFAGLVGIASLWNMWNGDVFPQEADPKGEPDAWTDTELRRWLKKRNLEPSSKMTREQLVQRVKDNLRVDKAKG